MNDRPLLDAVTLEVIRFGLLTGAAEMKNVVMRTAYANLWKEAGDLSCALLTADAQVVAQGHGDIPIHLATMPYSLRGCLERIPPETLRDGDVLFQNDPYQGNNHLPDFLMAKPVFVEGAIVGYAAVRGHYPDIGGSGPGSYSTVVPDIQAEGLRVPPTLVYREGVVNAQLLEIMAANMRNPRERMGDLRAQYAGCIAGERRLQALCSRYGPALVETAMAAVLDASERLTRARILAIPDGEYVFEDYCDGDGIGRGTILLRAKVTVAGDTIDVDFTDSSDQRSGGMNCPLAVTTSATIFAVKTLTDPENPANSGSYRPITARAPSGSVLNPVFPAPVVAGNHETATRVADVVSGALAQALPERVVAGGAGGSGVFAYGGVADGRQFVCVETHGAGQGAGSANDGQNAHRVSIGNTGNTPVEVLESSYPLHVLHYAISEDGGGPGRQRGGCGIERRVRLEHDGFLTVTVERSVVPPYGLFGGGSAALTRIELSEPGEPLRLLPSKTAPLSVAAGSELFLKHAGGGGYGDPLERTPAALQDDLDDGYVSPAAARERYGALLEHAPGRPDGPWLVVGRSPLPHTEP